MQIHISLNTREHIKNGWRNFHWKNVSKITQYEIDIIFESSCYDEVKNKEIELIAKYSPSCNITKGGEGTLGFSGKLHPKSKSVYQYNFNGDFIKEWESINIAGKSLNIFTTRIVSCLKGNRISTNGFRWSYIKHVSLPIVHRMSGKNQITKKKVNKIDIISGDIIETFESINSASKSVDVDTSKISQCCNGKRKTTRGFKWEFAI